MGIDMGIHPLLDKGGDKRKFRWLFTVEPYVGGAAKMLPPNKSARPNVSFKEYQAEHLHETIYFPGKVEWQTVDLSLYDVKCDENPIYEWMTSIYDPDPNSNSGKGFYGPSLQPVYKSLATQPQGGKQYKKSAVVTLYNGCGVALEEWVYQNAFPTKIDWGDLDMTSSEPTTVEMTLRFDRAYRVKLN